MKYYVYTSIIGVFLAMYFSMLMALKYSMESLIEKRFKQMELYEQVPSNGVRDHSNIS